MKIAFVDAYGEIVWKELREITQVYTLPVTIEESKTKVYLLKSYFEMPYYSEITIDIPRQSDLWNTWTRQFSPEDLESIQSRFKEQIPINWLAYETTEDKVSKTFTDNLKQFEVPVWSEKSSPVSLVNEEVGLHKDDGKPRVEFIRPEFILAMAEHLTKCMPAKYPDYNWTNGIDFTKLYNSIQRHLLAWYSGQDKDPETNTHHLISMCCNAMFIYMYQQWHMDSFDDRRNKTE